nr:PREDICTED: protein strawberry notch homolog 2 [Latimeria chalumnae]|eukprot:XP_014344033.1 PREDICTED: protein strawberry notch homolog 2 [Latimeria chalumnae]
MLGHHAAEPCLMVSVYPVMDGEHYSQPDHLQTNNTMYSASNIQTQFFPATLEGQPFPHSFCTQFSYQSPASYIHPPSLPTDNQPHFSNTSLEYMNTFSRPSFQGSDYFPTELCFHKNGDHQDLSFLEEFSNSTDSLSDIADIQDFTTVDRLRPTLQDVTTPQQNLMECFPPSRDFAGLSSLDELTTLINTSSFPTYQPPPPTEEEDEGEDEEAEELGHAETYADYVPLKSRIGKPHPDRVVETSTLSSVPPPDISYSLSLPESTTNSGLLSALQLEAIIYACQQHEVILQSGQRAGFLIGDGAGVGKGRTVAGIIFENYLKGRKKALWFSVSNDLKYDAERDLKDIDAANIPVHALNKIKYGDTATSEGVLFATYSALIGESQAGGQHRTRINQILEWCREGFDGVIVFDECHKAKNASSTKMGKAVLDLQNKLPLARVVYASATGASEPKNMIYMSRLGIWGEGTPFRNFEDFLHAIEKRGVGAMEIVAMDMKVSGMYIARQLSFTGVTFRIEEIPLDEKLISLYNKSAHLWAEAMNVFQEAADKIRLESRKSLWGQFWSTHQRFFKYLCIAAKVRRTVEIAKQELSKGKCVVIGLQSTGEARTREVLDENDGHLNHFVSAAEGVFLSLIQKHFPSTKRKRDRGAGIKRKRKKRGRAAKILKSIIDPGGIIKISDDSSSDSDRELDSVSNSSPESILDNDDVIFVDFRINGTLETEVEKLKTDLLSKVRTLGKELPLNTLDELIDQFGGPDCVAEMTGRKGRVVRRQDCTVCYESRAEQGLSIDNVNLKEKERFMDGTKLIAIISEASSSGISLQADRRLPNQKQRVHMTLELPWSADRAIQQFGRTHRSNQVSAPEYIFLISELAGERRFASIVAKRLESLGALTHGDRRATESRDLSKYNFENKYGARALDEIFKAISNGCGNKVPPPKGYPGGEAAFFNDMKYGLTSVGIPYKENQLGRSNNMEKDCSITKFLNRILGLEVHKQNYLFQYFTDTFDCLIEKDKRDGKYDMGILDLAPGVDEVYEETQEVFLTPGHPQDGQVVLYRLFFQPRGNKTYAALVQQGRGKNFILYKPNIGKQVQPESLETLMKKYRKVSPEEAKEHWNSQYIFSDKSCSHAVWNGKCKFVQEGKTCFMGKRFRQYYMLCGALLRVWNKVASIMADVSHSSYLQIVRLKTKEQKKQVGIKIPENCVNKVVEELKQMEAAVKKKQEERRQLQAQIFQTSSYISQQHPLDLQQHPLDLQQLSLDLQQHPLELQQHPLDLQQHPLDFQQHPLDLTQSLQQTLPLNVYIPHHNTLDLTNGSSIQSMPNVGMSQKYGTLEFPMELSLNQQQQLPMEMQTPFNFQIFENSLIPQQQSPTNNPPQYELHQNHWQTQQQDDVSQQESINFKEVLDEMLKSINDPCQENICQEDIQERQSVIHFGGANTNSWD